MQSRTFFGVLFLLAGLLIVGIFLFMSGKDNGGSAPAPGAPEEDISSIEDFTGCIDAGFPVMESYPRQCRTSDGRSFTEDIGNELEKTDLIRIMSPRPNATVGSPLVITGEARGYWYFEASFPVRLFDDNGNELAIAPAQARGEWMTEDFVPFEVELVFSPPTTPTGTLVLEKDNPSGLPEHADQIRIPVRFDMTEVPQRTIQLYYYDPTKDTDASGNIMCSDTGLVAVERDIPVTQTPIQDAVRLLLRGALTEEEVGRGITTEYPLEGLELEGASFTDGVLTLGFKDPNHATSGGSCRIGILWAQIKETAKQFEGVEKVRFQPEELFQP